MTREEAKRRAELYSALAEGKIIQFNQENGEWIDLTMELIEVLSESAFRYRIKPEPKYRPFKNQEECWNEMHNHPDFGWLTRIDTGEYTQIPAVFSYCILFNSATYNYEKAFEYYTFTDGTPFGIKEEENE